MSRPIIEVENLSKKYRLGVVGATTLRDDVSRIWGRLRGAQPETERGEFWALRDVSFSIQPGEVVGVIGRNGAGKSTLLKLLSRITEPTSGRALLRGRVASLLEVGTGFHPDLTGRENVFLNGAILGMKRTEIAARFDEIVAFAEVEKFIDTPVKHYSSGMRVRLAFAVAAHLDAEILIVDEVLAVGDLAFQQRCIKHVGELAAQKNRAVLLVSHQPNVMQQLANSALLLENGRLVARGDVADVLTRHTQASLALHHERAWCRATAPGDERCRMTAVRLIGDDGIPPSAGFACDRPPAVELDVWLAGPLRDLCVGFDLVSQQEGTVFRSFHTDAKHGPALKAGNNRLRCVLPASLLKGGTYDLHVRIGIHNLAWIVNQAPPLVFTLAQHHAEGSPLWKQTTSRPGVVAPLLKWTNS